MQLDAADRGTSVRSRLKAAACVLLATGASASRLARAADTEPKTTLDFTNLIYSERITVVEPTVRFTRLYPDGHSFHAQMTIDSITGASPSGALPSGQTQTITSASGTTSTVSADQIPTTTFKDTRVALDGEWLKPMKSVTYTLGGHFSREKDYQSLGGTGKLAFDFNQKLTTLTLGAGYSQDSVFPVGGVTGGLSPPGSPTVGTSESKRVASALLGVTQVLTRRWLVGVSASLTSEQGYLTEPYKILSVVDPIDGTPVGAVTEKRPDTRSRIGVQADSVYHFTTDLLYLTARHYWDDWGVRSNSIDMRYRHPVGDAAFVEPHVRYYAQGAADFYRFGLIQGQPLPADATADYRLGRLSTATAGLAIGFTPHGFTGEWVIRGEYMAQFGDRHPADAVGVQRQFNLFPTLDVFTFVVGYDISY